ncbi:MAG: tRNA 2-thiouridine(34) synthase MnmA [Candidatus Omnitrophica bacterium]|nr:tRNA 2-thiouridine(34) synthase MnmA [Candidatus Omnitrophota bacterium]
MKKKAKVAVGLSGGIDSSFAAYLLKKQGYDVCGFTLKFYPEENRCCDLDGLYQAQRLCSKLGIAHYTLDTTDFFKKEIVNYFVTSYLSGLTPNPCSFCNRLVKFGYLFEKVKAMGFDFLSTGHYVNIIKRKDYLLLKTAKDAFKSQEYFLGLIKPQALSSLIFPLGNYTKEKVKKIAKKEKLMFQERKESQDICFVKEKQYHMFIDKVIKNHQDYYGDILHVSGKVLGRHKGIYYFTYGQRAGLRVSWQEPLYVLRVSESDKSVIVGEKKYLAKENFSVANANWFIDRENYFKGRNPEDIKVKIRYNSKFHDCSLDFEGEKIKVNLKTAAEAVTPGQIAVFYHKDAVLAAGVIEKDGAE